MYYEHIHIGQVTTWDLAFLKVCHVRWDELAVLALNRPPAPPPPPGENPNYPHCGDV